MTPGAMMADKPTISSKTDSFENRNYANRVTGTCRKSGHEFEFTIA